MAPVKQGKLLANMTSRNQISIQSETLKIAAPDNTESPIKTKNSRALISIPQPKRLSQMSQEEYKNMYGQSGIGLQTSYDTMPGMNQVV